MHRERQTWRNITDKHYQLLHILLADHQCEVLTVLQPETSPRLSSSHGGAPEQVFLCYYLSLFCPPEPLSGSVSCLLRPPVTFMTCCCLSKPLTPISLSTFRTINPHQSPPPLCRSSPCLFFCRLFPSPPWPLPVVLRASEPNIA